MGAAFLAPALLSAAGTGLQYVNQKQANDRANAAEMTNEQEQQGLAAEANSGARSIARKIGNSSPGATANTESGAFVKALRANAAGAQTSAGTTGGTGLDPTASVSALPTTSVGSSRFKQDNATNQDNVQSYGSGLAKAMGAINAPILQRQDEGVDMQNYGTGLGLLQGQSNGLNFVNRLRAASSGQANPYLSLAGGLLQGAGNTWSKNTPQTGAYTQNEWM